ncbi:hypothetical protein AAIH46_06870 [Rhizobium sp. 0TCS1.26]|uniref:hypothetical protein n=1 Tax=Rhizobium sp. 0TCS1.26 TaxID=3142623 RepID=UPI003D29FCC4
MSNREDERPRDDLRPAGERQAQECVIVCFYTRRPWQSGFQIESSRASGTGPVEEPRTVPTTGTRETIEPVDQGGLWLAGAAALISIASIGAYSWALSEIIEALMSLQAIRF